MRTWRDRVGVVSDQSGEKLSICSLGGVFGGVSCFLRPLSSFGEDSDHGQPKEKTDHNNWLMLHL